MPDVRDVRREEHVGCLIGRSSIFDVTRLTVRKGEIPVSWARGATRTRPP
ncbi:hypothetical protein [Janibacter terrae]